MARSCADVEMLLSASLDDQLSVEEGALVRDHLEACDQCSRRFELLRATVASVRALPPPEIPPGFFVDLRMQLNREAPAEPPVFWFRRSVFAAVTTVVMLFVVIHAGGLFVQEDDMIALEYEDAAPLDVAPEPEPLSDTEEPMPSPTITVTRPETTDPLEFHGDIRDERDEPLQGGTAGAVTFVSLVAPFDDVSGDVSVALETEEHLGNEHTVPSVQGSLVRFFGSLVHQVPIGAPEFYTAIRARILLDVEDEPSSFAVLKEEIGRRGSVVLERVEHIPERETRFYMMLHSRLERWIDVFDEIEVALRDVPTITGIFRLSDDTGGSDPHRARILVVVRSVRRGR